MVARTMDSRTLASAGRFGIGLRVGFQRWIRLALSQSARNVSFAFER
jgi:hypothetical protein